MDESRLRMIEQIEEFLKASALVAFSPPTGDCERYGHISRVLPRKRAYTLYSDARYERLAGLP